MIPVALLYLLSVQSEIIRTSLRAQRADVDKYLMEVAKIDTLEEFQKCVGLVLDEMHIKRGARV